MTPHRFFCSESARARDEAIFGTAALIENWLLLEHPGAWSAQALPADRLSPSVQRRFDDLAKQFPRTRRLMIRQRHAHHEQMRLFLVQSSASQPVVCGTQLRSYEDLLAVQPAELLADATQRHDPFFLVCTHGKHDKCCAKFGFPTYCAMRDHGRAEVWQCSHVGGDRFASNVILLPHGIYYGNVLPDNAAQLIDAALAGNISLEHYRGRSCYARPAQVGEYFVRRESGILGFDDLAWRESVAVGPGRWRVLFRETARERVHEVEFCTQAAEFTALLTCHAAEAAPVSQYHLCSYQAL